MADKKSKNKKQAGSTENQQKRRIKTLQILFAVFSIILILSMVLSLMINT